jgi:His/Glu/Gln/Arg/opine family amino acid ABC transporter permease subunit
MVSGPMKSFRVLALCFVFFLGLVNSLNVCGLKSMQEIKSSGYIKMITNAEFPPFEFIDDEGEIKGIDIDISRKIADKLGVDFKAESVSFDAVLLELGSGSVDFAAAAMTYSDKRAQNFSFSDEYFVTTQKILVKKDSDIKSSSDLVGKKIGVALGTAGDSYCSSKEDFEEPVRFSKPADAVLDLVNLRLDAVVVDDLTATQLINAVATDSIIKIPEDLTSEKYAMVVEKGNKELLSVINEVIREIKKSGELDRIVDSYVNPKSAGNKSSDSSNSTDSNIYQKYSGLIGEGLKNTLLVTMFSLIIGVVLGTLAAVFRITNEMNNKFKFLSLVSRFYVTVIRGTPVIVQLFIIYYVVLNSVGISDKFTSAVMAFGINSGAYVSEIIRSGISSVDKGQFEAGYSLGLPYKDVMASIVLPQALKNVLPALVNEFISLLKETSVVGIVGLTDLTRAGDVIRSTTYEAFTPLMIVGVIYLVTVVMITRLVSLCERKLFKGDCGGKRI